MSEHRWLCLTIFNFYLDLFFTKVFMNVKKINKFYNQYNDVDAIHYFKMMRFVKWLFNIFNKQFFAHYVFSHFVKLRFVIELTHKICNIQNQKLFMFCDWSMFQWNTEFYFRNLDFKIFNICSALRSKKQKKVVKFFNFLNLNVQMLITFIHILITVLNLQKNCNDVVFLNVSTNAQTTVQCGDQMFRIGQKRICNLWIVTTNHTYNQVIQTQTVNKMANIIAGQNIIIIHFFQIKNWKIINSESNFNDKKIKAIFLFNLCHHLYSEQFDQRSNWINWTDVKNLTAKNHLSAKREFCENVLKLVFSFEFKNPFFIFKFMNVKKFDQFIQIHDRRFD